MGIVIDGGSSGKDTTSTKSTTPQTQFSGYGYVSWAQAGAGTDYWIVREAAGYNMMDLANYQAFVNNFGRDPYHQAFYGVYGEAYRRFALEATASGMTPERINEEMIQRGFLVTDDVANRIRNALSRGRGPGGGGGASLAQQYASAEAAIRNAAGMLGYTTIGEPRIKELAQQAVSAKWGNDQLMDVLVTEASSNWDALTAGTLTAGVEMAKAAAAQQLISISDQTAREWSARMSSGEMDTDGLRSFVQQQAIARYSWAADVLSTGVSMRDYLSPSRDRIAKELELTTEDIDLMDSQFMDLVTVKDETGATRVATDAELVRNARKDKRYANTSNARALASSAAVMLRNYVEGRS